MSVPFESWRWRWKFLLALTGKSGDSKPEPLLLQQTTLMVPPVIDFFWRIARRVDFFCTNGSAIGFWTSIPFKRFVSTAPRPWKGVTIKRPARLNLTIANTSLAYLERKQICWFLFLYPPGTISTSLVLRLKVGIGLKRWFPSLPIDQTLSTLSFERQQLFRNIFSQSCHPVSLSSRDLNLSMDLSLPPFAPLAPMLCSLTAPNLYSERYQNSYSTQSFLVWKEQKETHLAKFSKEIPTRETTSGSFNTAHVKHQSLPQFETELLDVIGKKRESQLL